MSKTKHFDRALACMLALVLAVACFCVPALAATPHNDATMQVPKQVTEVGTKTYYKVDGGIVVYSDQDGEGFTAVPSAYISGSEYNKGNVAYGAYVVGDGDTAEVVFIPMTDTYLGADGKHYFSHGTQDGATVSEKVDTATNKDPQMGTDFYLRVENGIDPDGPSKEDVVPGQTTADDRISYDITVQTKASYQLNATVPAYVCMYGYRGTGTVVTPTSEAYQLKNYSTMNMDSKATIVDIVKVTKMTQILDEDHSNETLTAIAYNTDSKQYMWWYEANMPSEGKLAELEDQNWVINKDIAAEKLNASGECYVIYVDDAWTFKAAGVLDNGALREQVNAIDAKHPLDKDFTFGDWTFGKEGVFEVGAIGEGGGDKVEGMAIKVTEIQAIPATWRLVPMNTGINSIGRGEIAMSIAPSKAVVDASAIDLAACSAPVDITERGWYLAAPNIGEDGVKVDTPTTLPLITSARMAGGNVNASGCTSVVRVVYTVTPLFGIQDGQTNVVGGVDSNRAAA